MRREQSTEISTDRFFHGYQSPTFGRGYLKDKFQHGNGLFFPELTDKTTYFKNGTPIPKAGNCVACTFVFETAVNDPSLQERTEGLKQKLIGYGAVPQKTNSYQEAVGFHDLIIKKGKEIPPHQVIEFKFRKTDEDVARQAILKIDAMAGGRISARLGLR